MHSNDRLPEPLQKRIKILKPGSALSLGVESGEPMLLLRLDDADEVLLNDPGPA